jgi:hypothetical protein
MLGYFWWPPNQHVGQYSNCLVLSHAQIRWV